MGSVERRGRGQRAFEKPLIAFYTMGFSFSRGVARGYERRREWKKEKKKGVFKTFIN